MSALLEARGLSYSYPGGVSALAALDISVGRGRKLAILGPNGAGKTTLLLHLNGTLRPSSGDIRLDGAAVGYERDALIGWRRRVGLVLQDADDQLFAASVAEDVSFGPLNLGLSDEETRRRVAEALAALKIADLAERPTHMLSFGQKKRAAIAGALAMRPEILLLDEPTAGLDRAGAALLLDALKRLSEAGTTLVFTTHDVDLAWAFADEAALFCDGRVVAQGDVAEVLVDGAVLARAQLQPPLLARLGLALRDKGLLDRDAGLPRQEDALLALINRG
ncbi:cobalt ABC transporter ATP-binding protein [Rhodoblastus sphagnicola]|uniref:ABC transporter ATP-binding protein n=1 Tax=Rhodoblastus sphagnicola TaxID=333368 RepID=A0A2S6N8Z6_9HYPH|nr:ATP-binding cassette domain-containing protein [Rhodoblastus sphagnicola]MBB4196862.1 cobalt/nickel transport system ATP-binding protein [Rhodoblastus sphagnicola]PPQ31084.1 cobalt ABC transporter ATP-binding protein [Rhodoblastus sphagnicola]